MDKKGYHTWVMHDFGKLFMCYSQANIWHHYRVESAHPEQPWQLLMFTMQSEVRYLWGIIGTQTDILYPILIVECNWCMKSAIECFSAKIQAYVIETMQDHQKGKMECKIVANNM